MSNHVCSAKHAAKLDNGLRKILHDPYKMFSSYINEGDTVYDIGCGPGTFTMELAAMTGRSGRVIAVDLQQKMLDLAARKVRAQGMEEIVTLHKCGETSIGFTKPADVILGFFMVHELPDTESFLHEAYSALKPGGLFIIIEPIIHVSKKTYKKEVALAEKIGLQKIADRNVFCGRGAVLQKK